MISLIKGNMERITPKNFFNYLHDNFRLTLEQKTSSENGAQETNEHLDNCVGIYEKPTHVAIPTRVTRTGKWRIPEDRMEEVINMYSRSFDENLEQRPVCTNLTLSESTKEFYGPIFIDIDLVLKNVTETVLTDERLDRIVGSLRKILWLYLGANIDVYCIITKRLKSLELEPNTETKAEPKAEPSRKAPNLNKWKEGIHIIFPFIQTTYRFQFALREFYINQYFANDFDFNTGQLLVPTKVYDINVINSSSLLMYGSGKKNKIPYLCYKQFGNTIDFMSMSNLEKVKCLSVRKEGHLAGSIKNYEFDLIDQSLAIINMDVPLKNNPIPDIFPDVEHMERIMNGICMTYFSVHANWTKLALLLKSVYRKDMLCGYEIFSFLCNKIVCYKGLVSMGFTVDNEIIDGKVIWNYLPLLDGYTYLDLLRFITNGCTNKFYYAVLEHVIPFTLKDTLHFNVYVKRICKKVDKNKYKFELKGSFCPFINNRHTGSPCYINIDTKNESRIKCQRDCCDTHYRPEKDEAGILLTEPQIFLLKEFAVDRIAHPSFGKNK